jgi:hypothetical protein
MRRKHMRLIIATGIAALLIGTSVASAPAFAQASSHSGRSTSMAVGNHGRTMYNYAGRVGVTPSKQAGEAKSGRATYSGLGPRGAPLSPGGIGTAANSFGGAGYDGPYG